ncbi:exported hypothetical protein [Vibrio chagasii]|nr:exported hypothetical protein [Vibrio chagasii]
MKLTKTVAVAALILSPVSSANVLGFGGGMEFNVLNPSYELKSGSIEGKEGGTTGVTLHLEHPLPFLPNARFDSLTVKGGDSFKYNQHNFTGYYRLLDIDIVKVNAGAGITNISGTKWMGEADKLDKNAGHIFAEGEARLPFTGISTYASLLKATGSKYSGMDNRIGLRYTLDVAGIEPSASVGYRYVKQEFRNIDSNKEEMIASGMYLNLKVAF